MVNFDQAGGENKPRLGHDDDCRGENCDDEFDQPPEKKRRLTAEQVQFLEKSFDVDNKLEPDRKIQLAKDLGLHPRQVAIWFQNRRARYKTKLLEKDYDSLKSSYHKLKADYDNLFSDNEKLKNELHLLSRKLGVRENVDPLDFQAKDRKPEDASSSARSDVLDTDSSGALEIASHAQDEDESLVVQRLCFPKLEAEFYYDDLQPNSCNLGFPAQNQGTWFWQY